MGRSASSTNSAIPPSKISVFTFHGSPAAEGESPQGTVLEYVVDILPVDIRSKGTSLPCGAPAVE